MSPTVNRPPFPLCLLTVGYEGSCLWNEKIGLRDVTDRSAAMSVLPSAARTPILSFLESVNLFDFAGGMKDSCDNCMSLEKDRIRKFVSTIVINKFYLVIPFF